MLTGIAATVYGAIRLGALPRAFIGPDIAVKPAYEVSASFLGRPIIFREQPLFSISVTFKLI